MRYGEPHAEGMYILHEGPYGVFNGMAPDADIDALYLRLIEALNDVGLVYLHVVDHSAMGAPPVSKALKAQLRAASNGKYILSGGYDAARANADLAAAFGNDAEALARHYVVFGFSEGRSLGTSSAAAPAPASLAAAFVNEADHAGSNGSDNGMLFSGTAWQNDIGADHGQPMLIA